MPSSLLAGTNPQEKKMYSAETWMPWKEFISQLGRGSDIWLRQGVGTVLQAIWLSSLLVFGKLIYPSSQLPLISEVVILGQDDLGYTSQNVT